jgi:hypothetical protein
MLKAGWTSARARPEDLAQLPMMLLKRAVRGPRYLLAGAGSGLFAWLDGARGTTHGSQRA